MVHYGPDTAASERKFHRSIDINYLFSNLIKGVVGSRRLSKK